MRDAGTAAVAAACNYLLMTHKPAIFSRRQAGKQAGRQAGRRAENRRAGGGERERERTFRRALHGRVTDR